MKLLKLTMCAFGPYKCEQVINFSEINNKKLFLITGPTGAGKTAIFDAISYALYGLSSGNDRDGDTFRSHFASIDEETYVRLEFEIKGIKYIVRRSPKQEKRKVKGEGITIKPPEAVLEIRNGKTYTGVVEVNKQILFILGINYQQFKQIVMLPQGEFRKLLEANSLDRETIFRKIFKTEAFLAIQENLKNRASLLKNEIGENYLILNNLVCQIKTDDELLQTNTYSEYKDFDLIISLLKETIKANDKKLDQHKLVIKEKEKAIFTFEKKITEGKMINQKFNDIDELKFQKQRLDKELDNIELLEVRISKGRLAQIIYQIEVQVNKLKESITELKQVEESLCLREKLYNEDLIKLNEDLKSIQKDYKNINKLNEELYILKDKLKKSEVYECEKANLEAIEIKRSEYEKNIQNKKNAIDQLNESEKEIIQQLTEYDYINNELNNLKLRKESLDIRLKSINFAYKLLLEIKNLLVEHLSLSETYQKEKKIYVKLKNRYESNFDIYKSGQAGILASSLKPNEPCPVCGSPNHPNKAEIPLDSCSVEKLEESKEKLEVQENIYNKAYTNLLSKHQIILDKKKLVEGLDEKIEGNNDIDQLLVIYRDLINENNDSQSKTSNSLTVLEKQFLNKKEIEEKLKLINEDIQSKENELTELKEIYHKVDNDYHVRFSSIKKLEFELTENTQEIKAKIAVLEAQIEKITSEYQKISNLIQEKNEALIVLQTELKSLEKNLKLNLGAYDVEVKQFERKLSELNFSDVEEYKEYLFSDKDTFAFEKKVRNYYDEVSYINKSLLKISEELNDFEIINLEELITDQSNLKAELEKLRIEESEMHLVLQINVKILSDIEELFKKIKTKLEEFGILSDISKVANGDNPQKLTFERYVLAAYFDEIIYSANLHLSDMTSGRYYLCRKEEKGKGSSQQGLDLEVIDNFTCKNRTVKTLSGGEAFIASLALALGLADVVQSYSGGIQLDTIFIDEGFGSLDPESLENAIDTLANIQKAGRLVGIISHVQELKERIDVKIEISPSKQGSSAKLRY